MQDAKPSFWIYPVSCLILGGTYLIFAWQHLYLASIFDPQLVFGNDGDGFFNLWILEHNRQNFFSGLDTWLNGRIFYPDNHKTLLWSDLLLIPTLPYALFHALGLERFCAYRLTILLSSLIGYGSTFLTLWLFNRWSNTTSDKARSFTLPLLFTLALVFSMNLLSGYQHFQNLSWIGIVLIILGVCGFTLTTKKRYLALALGVEVGLLATAPYFAVMGMVLFGLWFLLFILRHGQHGLVICISHWKTWLPFSFLAAIPVLLYRQVPHLEYNMAAIHNELATNFSDFFIPPQGVLRSVLDITQLSLPRTHHESPAYLGLGFLLLLFCFPLVQLQLKKDRPKALKSFFSRLGPILITYIVYRLVRDIDWAGYCMAWVYLASVAFFLLPYFRQSRLSTARGFLSGFLLLATIISMGFAMGPNHHFLDYGLNPSIYGLLEEIVPGVANMRAIGRMAAIGYLCLGFWLFLQCSDYIETVGHKQSQTALMVFVVALSLQLMETWPVKTMTNHYKVQALEPAPAETKLLQSIKGTAVFFPTTPWHRNTHLMLYLSSFKDITLVNGYSAKSTPFFDKFMAAEDNGEPSEPQLQYLHEIGCEYLIVNRRKLSRDNLKRLVQKYPIHQGSKKLIVFSLQQSQ